MSSPKSNTGRRIFIVAVDGPGGVGKSTVSKLLARSLGFKYVDTGAMYRAFAVGASESGVELTDDDGLREFSKSVTITFDEGGEKVYFNNADLSEKIRTPEAGRVASIASARAPVRDFLVKLQREFGQRVLDQGRGVVMEGRDIGTVVFPDADVKVFLDAPESVRAERRHGELAGGSPGVSQGSQVKLDDVKKELSERDSRDSMRAHSPLRRADDAHYIDTNGVSIEAVVERILSITQEKRGD